jgi:chromosome segregation ATPase
MEVSKLSEGENLDDSLYSDADLTSHLREKIRQQASRLRSLEQYRVQCEKRIQELCPGHPLPIKEEQRSSFLSQSQELQLAREKIQRLEGQLSHQNLEGEEVKEQGDYLLLLEKYNDLLKDKTDLEESLRAEMLNCEEQRTYIELLKQTIEGKLEEMDGISLDPKAMSVINNSRSKIDDSRREQSRMRNAILDYESQIKRLSHKLKTRESENDMLVKEREELDTHLRQAAEALQIAEEEVAKLEEEKLSMIEYLNQSTTKEREMEKELNDLSRYFEEMKKDFHETLKTLEIMKNKEAKQEAENEVHKEEIFRTSQQYTEMQSLVDSLKKTNQDKEAHLKAAKEEKMMTELKVEKLQAHVASLTESLKDTQNDASRLQEQLDSYSRQEVQKSENLTRLKGEHMSLYQENSIFKEKILILNKELESSKKALNELERIRELDIKQLQEFKAKLLDYQAKNEILEGFKKNRNDNEQSRRSEQSRFAQLEEEIQYLTESLREMQHKENVISQNFNEVKVLNSKLSNQIEELYLENDSYRIELEKKAKEAELYISKFNHLNEYYESIETDKSELEDVFKNY